MARLSSRWGSYGIALTALAVALTCQSKTPSPPSGPTASSGEPEKQVDAELLSQLAVLATGSPPSSEELSEAPASLGSYIDQLLSDPRLGREVVSQFTFRDLLVTPGFATAIRFYTLKQAKKGESEVYYLRKPCAADEAVAVRPWWAMDREILVCPKAYQPEHWVREGSSRRYDNEEFTQHCNSFAGSPLHESSAYCGCGPNLIRCYRDEQHLDEILASMKEEFVRTVGFVVENDLPISKLFTSQATFHDRNVAFIYRKWRIEDQKRADPEALRALSDWPEQGKWASRPEWAPGQHAGLITAPRLLHEHSDRRQRMRDIYNKIWCSEPGSFGASAEQVLSLEAKSFQIEQEGWEDLARRPLCTNCHARLDYGWQFMLGWGDGRVNANHFVASLQQGEEVGPLYASNIKDKRGEGPLNTETFGKLAVAQPEFRDCMVGNVARHVFGHHATTDDQEALKSAYAERPTFKNLMRTALVRYAESWGGSSEGPPSRESIAAAPVDENGAMQVSGPLRAAIEDSCVFCHEEFEPEVLPRSLVVRMLDQVAWGRMPKEMNLEPIDRYGLVRTFIDTLWQKEELRQKASQHFIGRMSAVPVHSPAFSREIIGVRAGARTGESETEWTLIEPALGSDKLSFTPGFAAFVGMEALKVCKQAGYEGDSLERCLGRTTDAAAHSKVRLPAPER